MYLRRVGQTTVQTRVESLGLMFAGFAGGLVVGILGTWLVISAAEDYRKGR